MKDTCLCGEDCDDCELCGNPYCECECEMGVDDKDEDIDLDEEDDQDSW